eukprot:5778085-Amphidinium_carterae.2
MLFASSNFSMLTHKAATRWVVRSFGLAPSDLLTTSALPALKFGVTHNKEHAHLHNVRTGSPGTEAGSQVEQ